MNLSRRIARAQALHGVNPGIAPGTPLDAFRQHKSYQGPPMADKGRRDGCCNRSACQLPLKGGEQWFMRDLCTTNGRLYYCGRCAELFNRTDREFREPQRCTFDAEASAGAPILSRDARVWLERQGGAPPRRERRHFSETVVDRLFTDFAGMRYRCLAYDPAQGYRMVQVDSQGVQVQGGLSDWAPEGAIDSIYRRAATSS